MTKLHNGFILTMFTVIMVSCSNETYQVKDFSADELMWYSPYKRTQTVVFISEKNESDTIVFHKATSARDSTRDFEQGFSNTKYLTVSYDFSKGSYHQFAGMGDGKTRYDQDFINMYKSSAGYGSLEITFIGTLFNDSIKNIQKVNDSIYYFDSRRADYSGVDVEKGIKNFTFNTHIGITQYTDDRNIKWYRKQDSR